MVPSGTGYFLGSTPPRPRSEIEMGRRPVHSRRVVLASHGAHSRSYHMTKIDPTQLKAIATRFRRATTNVEIVALCDAVLAMEECPECKRRREMRTASQRRWRKGSHGLRQDRSEDRGGDHQGRGCGGRRV